MILRRLAFRRAMREAAVPLLCWRKSEAKSRGLKNSGALIGFIESRVVSLNASQPYEGEPNLAIGENQAKLHYIRTFSSTAFCA
jgi:hypothetical protein